MRNAVFRMPARPQTRRAAVVVYVLIGITATLGFAALAVDVGMLYSARSELQRTADASALSASWSLLDARRVKGGSIFTTINNQAKADAVALSQKNTTLDTAGTVSSASDVTLGHVSYHGVASEVFNNAASSAYNASYVIAKRDNSHGGSISLFFARALGVSSSDLNASATAAFWDSIQGFKVSDNSGNASLLPFALHINTWNALIAGTYSTGDAYNYDTTSGTVSSGSDGVNEINLYPGAGTNQLPPGNFGTVDIGSCNNSTADISRQIRYGVNASDLSYFPNGELKLGSNGTLSLNGDTGLSAGIKDDLISIIGQPRTIPLFNAVSGNGNNSHYTIVGFAGIRILNVKLTGAMNQKAVIIQPAVVVDQTAQGGSGNTSTYVYTYPRLIN